MVRALDFRGFQLVVDSNKGVRTNFGVGGRRGEALVRAKSRGSVLGEETTSPSPPARVFGSAVSSPNGPPKGFLVF